MEMDILLNKEKRGEIHVNLMKKVKFLKEEEALVREISGKISRALEKNEKKNALEEQQKVLLSKNETLIKLSDQLHRSSDNFRTFFGAIADRIVVIDPEYNIIMSNKEEIGNSGKCYEKLFNADQRCDTCNAVVTFGEGKNSMIEKSINGKHYLMRSYPILDKEGEVESVIEVCRDITLNKQLESQLIQSYKLASLGKLVAGVAHEINNPNTFILGNLKIIQEAFDDLFPVLDTYYGERPDEKVARLPYDVFKENISVLIKDMIEGANRTKQIVLDLRNFARKDEESLSDVVDINYLIKNHLTFTQKHIKKQANIEYNLDPDVPKFTGSIQKLEQVLMNLVINASQAVENGMGLITITTHYEKSSNEVIINVSDDGKGMDEKTRKNIFDPFFTTKRDKGGTGLGLSISYGIIKDHNGKIEVESKLGSGTTFTIRIPAILKNEK
jgi:signal transduction histidine kinase